jgi:hypothetical protein
MHETKAFTVTEVNNRCSAGGYTAWVNLYITRGTEEE